MKLKHSVPPSSIFLIRVPISESIQVSPVCGRVISNKDHFIEVHMRMAAISEIKEFYKDTSIFITGGTGFLGKMIIEKLLRSCPGIRKFYVLCRSKKGKTIIERLDEQFDDVLYDRVKEMDPQFKSKIVPIQGDCAQNNLGISLEDTEMLINEVNIIFHCAATVRLDETLHTNVPINIRSTRDLIFLAHSLKRLKVFVYLSTAFSQCILQHIEEKLYEPPFDGNQLMRVVEYADEDTLRRITPGLLGEYPNSYVYSKAVAEDVIKQNSGGLPICVIRPSIISSTFMEPFAGWCGNTHGPAEGAAAFFLGVLHTWHCDTSKIATLVPADYVANVCIVVAWDTAQIWNNRLRNGTTNNNVLGNTHEIPVYNYTGCAEHACTWGEYKKRIFKWFNALPSMKSLWVCFAIVTKYEYIDFIYRCLFHFLPGYILDGLLFFVGIKPRYIKLYKHAHKYIGIYSHFANRQWNYDNENTVKLYAKLNNVDKKLFNFDMSNIDWNEYYKNYVTGIRVYILKDPLTTLPQARRKQMMFRVINKTILVVALYYIGSFFIKCIKTNE